MNKSEVIQIIDNVMNDRNIDSIRDALLTIRDKVLALEDDDFDRDYYARLKLRGNNPLNCSIPYFPGAQYIEIDTFEKIDTGIYGDYRYV